MKIGVFDSGLGGLTILKALREAAPLYDYHYLGDSARTPYGNRSFDSILKFTTQAVQYLFEQNCHLIILACNTASAKALRTLQQKYLPFHFPDRRILGVVRPSAEELGRFTSTRSVAIWGTVGTVQSQSYVIELNKLFPDIKVTQQACPMLVPLIENGESNNPATLQFIQKYWDLTLTEHSAHHHKQISTNTKPLDTLLLACTHYPLIKSKIERVISPDIKIIGQNEIMGPKFLNYLQRHPEHETKLEKNSSLTLETTDQPQNFSEMVTQFLGVQLPCQKIELNFH